ncbi:MAG: segregation/condensation protein A [Candidatus Aenigmarchaeota archaeon]|nr:segregation/condensation protein A [Candidatus Aenigmarchaeota archaeon]
METQEKITEENILKVVIERESWEQIIYYIVNVERIDPWDVDIVKLCDGFINFLRKVESLDFRIPAKVVFVAAILLRLKSEYLMRKEEEKIEEKEEEIPTFLEFDPSKLKLAYPVKRIPKVQITLEELIIALKKAVEIEEKKKSKKSHLKEKLIKNINLEEDITKRIENVFKKIEEKSKDREKVMFKEIVENWESEEIVKNFVPLLHLEKNEKISTEQEAFFKEIFISLKKEKFNEQNNKVEGGNRTD